jgi:glycosyltransferase involved in cell wall biosynthesis
MTTTGQNGPVGRRIRVLFVIDSFYVGGTEKQCYELAAHLDRTRFDVGVVTLNASGPLRARFETLGCPLYEVPFTGSYWRLQSFRPLIRLARIMRTSGADLVQTFGFYSNVPGVAAARLAGVRGVIAGRRFTLPDDPALNHHISPAQDCVDRLLWRLADRVVVNATAIRDQLVARGVDPAKVLVIHNGVDDRAATLAGGGQDGGVGGATIGDGTVGMVANFRPDKDHAMLLRAARDILQHRKGVRFLLAGSGPLEDRMREYARDLGVAEAVTFLGARYGAELYRMIAACSVMVLCSKGNEGLPNVLLEAMALGKPVVATTVGGTADVVQDGVTGFLVDRGDAKALTDKILFLLEHRQAAREMGAAGRTRIQQGFTIGRMTEQFEALYIRILDEKGKR